LSTLFVPLPLTSFDSTCGYNPREASYLGVVGPYSCLTGAAICYVSCLWLIRTPFFAIFRYWFSFSASCFVVFPQPIHFPDSLRAISRPPQPFKDPTHRFITFALHPALRSFGGPFFYLPTDGTFFFSCLRDFSVCICSDPFLRGSAYQVVLWWFAFDSRPSLSFWVCCGESSSPCGSRRLGPRSRFHPSPLSTPFFFLQPANLFFGLWLRVLRGYPYYSCVSRHPTRCLALLLFLLLTVTPRLCEHSVPKY